MDPAPCVVVALTFLPSFRLLAKLTAGCVILAPNFPIHFYFRTFWKSAASAGIPSLATWSSPRPMATRFIPAASPVTRVAKPYLVDTMIKTERQFVKMTIRWGSDWQGQHNISFALISGFSRKVCPLSWGHNANCPQGHGQVLPPQLLHLLQVSSLFGRNPVFHVPRARAPVSGLLRPVRRQKVRRLQGAHRRRLSDQQDHRRILP